MDKYDAPYFCNPDTWEAAKRTMYALLDGYPSDITPLMENTRRDDPSSSRRARPREDAFSPALIPASDRDTLQA